MRASCLTSEGDFPRWKRALDLLLVVGTAPVWLPLMVLLALLIKGLSRGPVFFRQERVGHHGRHFTCYKFRSMKPGAATRVHEDYLRWLIQSDCPMTKLDQRGDARLIPLGRILRSTGLDELPQLFNVLRGEMTLVGPRPCTPHEFQSAPEFLSRRLSVPPGLTGYWQVNGKNKTTFREMIAMDEHYARNLSLGLDLRILFKTFPALLGQVLASRCPGGEAPAKVAAQSGAGAHPQGGGQRI